MKYLKSSWSLLFFAAICLFGLFIEMSNGRFELNDLLVYYRSASRLMDGQNLYRIETDIFYVFKYSPVSALYFIPLTVLNFSIAKVIYWLGLSALFVFGLKYCTELISGNKLKQLPQKNALIFFLGASVFIHIFRELHLGQVNFVLFMFFVFACGYLLKKRENTSAFFLASTLFFKPFGLIFIVYFLWKKKFSYVLKIVVWVIGLSIIPLIFYQSIDLWINQYTMWFSEIFIELFAKKDLLQAGNHSIFSLLYRHFHLDVFFKSAIPQLIYTLLIFSSIAGLVLYYMHKTKKSERALVFDFALLAALIPLLSYTSRNAYLFTMLLITVLLVNFKRVGKIARAGIIIGMLFIGGNNIEILGRDLTLYLEGISIVSIGTVILLGVLLTNLSLIVNSEQSDSLKNQIPKQQHS